MQFKDVIAAVEVLHVFGNEAPTIEGIAFDSRAVQTNSIFVAVRGTQTDGHQYIEQAVAKGATVIIAEEEPTVENAAVTWVLVPNSAVALGQLAAHYYGHPSKNLKLVGVTGTNGKTTTVTLLYRLFQQLGYKVGLLSTIENRIHDQVLSATHTTPNPLALNALLADMVAAGCEFAFMEVSSHAVAQGRVAGLQFTGGVFTNLSHDHLDYHGSFAKYRDAKKQFFDDLPKGAFALTNVDDRNGKIMLQNTAATKKSYSLRTTADYRAKILENTLEGLHLTMMEVDFYSSLIGKFNAYNLLVVFSVADLLDQDKGEILLTMSALKEAPGRFERIQAPKRGVLGIVDYAHTPDALEKVLETIHAVQQGGGKLITVIGCGGDRDRKKRPLMAKLAAAYSTMAIFTSDNPRTEDPDAIIEEMENGLTPDLKPKVISITRRDSAIKLAARLAEPGSVILVAGKGHETYQEINGERFPFDDKTVLKEALEHEN